VGLLLVGNVLAGLLSPRFCGLEEEPR
jgi:hypothetical protein